MTIGAVVTEPSVFELDESSRLMNRPPAVLFTTPLPSEPPKSADNVLPVSVGMLKGVAGVLSVDEAKGLPLRPTVVIAEPVQILYSLFIAAVVALTHSGLAVDRCDGADRSAAERANHGRVQRPGGRRINVARGGVHPANLDQRSGAAAPEADRVGCRVVHDHGSHVWCSTARFARRALRRTSTPAQAEPRLAPVPSRMVRSTGAPTSAEKRPPSTSSRSVSPITAPQQAPTGETSNWEYLARLISS
jgi:hypothetical protein